MERHLKKAGKGSQAIATDDLLPLLASVLVQARVANMPAWLNCMEGFAGKGASGKPEFSYTSTTLRAAMDVVSGHSEDFPAVADISVDITTPFRTHDASNRNQRPRPSSVHQLSSTGNGGGGGHGRAPANGGGYTGGIGGYGSGRSGSTSSGSGGGYNSGGYLDPRPYRSLPTSPGSGRRASAPSIGTRHHTPGTLVTPHSPSSLARGSDRRSFTTVAGSGAASVVRVNAVQRHCGAQWKPLCGGWCDVIKMRLTLMFTAIHNVTHDVVEIVIHYVVDTLIQKLTV